MINTKIKGNIKNRRELERIVQNNTVLHSYLFLGENGIGKKEIAREFAKQILCLTHKNECDCKSCICFETDNHPDFQLINDEGDTIKISTIREMIATVYEKPILSDKKIYIINDADKMTKEAQNSLLKTLEEPPEYITIILICTNEGNLLSTIKSRCTRMQFEPIKDEELKEYIKTKLPEEQISENIIELAQGSIEKAIKLNERKDIYENIENILLSMQNKDLIDIVQMSEVIYKSKEEIKSILEYINVLLMKLSKQNIKYINCVQIVEETKRRIKANSNYDMCIDYMIFSMWQNVERTK